MLTFMNVQLRKLNEIIIFDLLLSIPNVNIKLKNVLRTFNTMI